MNTNTTLPIVAINADGDREGHRSFLTFRWDDGNGREDFVGIRLDLTTHEGGQDGLAENVKKVLQHVYLMGYQDGAFADYEAGINGYRDGMVDGIVNPHQNVDARYGSWENGAVRRRNDYDTGQRIEALIGERARDRDLHTTQATTIGELQRNILTVTSERDEAIERVQAMEVQIVGLHADIAGVASERDEFLEKLNSLQGDMIRGADGELVTRWAYDSLARQGHILLTSRDERIAALETELTATYGRLSYVQEELSAADHDARTIADALLNEAEERRWCSEYDDFVNGVNADTNRHKLTVRSQEYDVVVSVSQSIDYTVVDTAASEAGFPISYDVNNAEAEATYHFTIECGPSEISSKAEQLRRAVYSVSGVSSASVEWEEAG